MYVLACTRANLAHGGVGGARQDGECVAHMPICPDVSLCWPPASKGRHMGIWACGQSAIGTPNQWIPYMIAGKVALLVDSQTELQAELQTEY